MLADKNACTGCNVCQNVCGKNCIAMKYDEEGFWHPVIDSDLCVHCGLCEKVCPVLHKNEEDNFKNPETYAVQDKTAANLQISSSGGIFGVIAEYIIGQGGIVYGAVYGKHSKVVYGRADNTEILKKIRGTKYVQADVKMAFKEAGHDLKSGKMVLFSGTPCIIAALYNYVRTLQIDESKLFTVDLICHGVPSPLFFDRFIAELEKENEKEILEFIFRPKNLEWGQVSACGRPSIKFLDKTQSSISKNDKEYYLGLLNSPLDEVREILKAEGWEEVNGRTNPSYGDSWEHWERNRIRIEILFTSDTNQINAMAYGDAKFQSEEHYLRRFMNSIPTEEFEKLLENEGWELFTQKLGASSWKEYHRQASNRLEKLTLTYHGNELVDLSYDYE